MRNESRTLRLPIIGLTLLICPFFSSAAEEPRQDPDGPQATLEKRVQQELKRLEEQPEAAMHERSTRALAGPQDERLIQAADKIAEAIANGDNSKYVPAFRESLQFITDLEMRLSRSHVRTRGIESPSSSIETDPRYIENAKKLIREQQRVPRVIGGVETGPDQFPDCVAVGSATNWCCSGTLVAPNVVVTAGHCAAGCAKRVFVGPDVNKAGDVMRVSKAVRHSDYGKGGRHNDLTVLILERDVDSAKATPREIAPAGVIDKTFYVRVAGFGNTDVMSTRGYGIRRMVDVPIATADCARNPGAHPGYGCDEGLELVAGAPFLDKDSCNGDSGGPAYVLYEGAWYLAGATSRPTAGSSRPCGDGGIYVRLDEYSDWIRSVDGGHWGGKPGAPGNQKDAGPGNKGETRRDNLPPAAALSPAADKRHALLIAVTRYENFPGNDLEGPANDVILTKETLSEVLGIPDSNIVTLSEAKSRETGDPKSRPTRENIKREFDRLGQITKEGHKVFLLLSGHGSVQPDLLRPDPKPDRQSEIFLPADTGKWEKLTKRVKNAVIDFEMRDWVGAIQKTGATVWMVVDSCHSGTIIRGLDDVTLRRIDNPRGVFSIPEAAYAEARRREVGGRGGQPQSKSPLEKPGLVGLYAAMPNEPTFEDLLPYGDAVGKKKYGVLTWFLNESLRDVSNSNHDSLDITYSELLQRIRQKYAASGLSWPHPAVEGEDRNLVIFGGTLRRSSIFLTKDADGGWTINAGILHGFNDGTILAVFPPAGEGQGEKPLGYVKISKADSTKSTVEPVEFEKIPAPGQLPERNARCEPVFITFGDLRIELGVAETDAKGEKINQEARIALVEQLKSLPEETKRLIEIVERPEQARWLLRIQGDDVHLVRREGMQIPLAPIPRSKLAAELAPRLRAIARVEMLKQLAKKNRSSERGSRVGRALSFDVELIRNPDEEAKGQVVQWPEGLTLKVGEQIALGLRNRGQRPADVTILHIDPLYGIHLWFPPQQFVFGNRLPQAGLQEQPVYTDPADVAADGVGVHYFVALAVPGEGPPSDFSGLEQDSLKAAKRGLRGDLANPDSDIGNLIDSLYGAGTRDFGLKRKTFDDFVIRLYEWRIPSSEKKGGEILPGSGFLK